MYGINYYKADSSTYVIKSSNGKIRRKGKGLSFFYSSATTTIVAIPVTAQVANFIFKLQTADYQQVTAQGQVVYRVAEPEIIAEALNFSLNKTGTDYISKDPIRLDDQVIKAAQVLVQNQMQVAELREALAMVEPVTVSLKGNLQQQSSLQALGVAVLDVSVAGISPTPETAKALETEAREALLKEADDAIYLRRKAAVEQERTIQEAELQTQLSIQNKEQEIEQSRIANERAALRSQSEVEKERIQAEVDQTIQRKELVAQSVQNRKTEAAADAYAIEAKMNAFSVLPVENLKALAMANMQPEQLMAMAFESLAQNADKIGELTITPDLFSQMIKRNVKP